MERQRGWVVHDSGVQFAGTQSICDGVAVSASQDALQAYAERPDGPFRLLLGYAGWGPGQLESEIRQGSWLTGPVQARLLFEVPSGAIWREALRSVGVDPTHLVGGSDLLN